MTTPHQGPNGRQTQQSRHSGSGDSFVAGGNITFTPPPPAPPPPRRSKARTIAIGVSVAAAMVLVAALSAQLGRYSADQDSRAAHGSQDSPGGATAPPAAGVPSAGSGGLGWGGVPEGSDTPAPPAASPGRTAGGSGKDGVRYQGGVRLAAVDLDANPPTVKDTDGYAMSGFSVMYPNLSGQGAVAFGTSGSILNRTPALAIYTRPGSPSRKDCSDLLRTQASEMLQIEEGSRLCVKTVSGRIAFVTAGRFTNGAFDGQAFVWEAIG